MDLSLFSKMNRVAFSAWAIPFGIALFLILGMPSSLLMATAFGVTLFSVGFYGIFMSEVTKYVIQTHPIQTVFNATLISGILLSLNVILVLAVFTLPALLNTQGDSFGWAIMGLYVGILILAPHAAISAMISMVLCILLPTKLNRENWLPQIEFTSTHRKD